MRPFSLFSPLLIALAGACGGNVHVGAGGGGEGGGTTSGPPGEPCSWNGTEAVCPDGTYCLAPECGSGTCEPLEGTDTAYGRVCGCDGLSYWNASLAASSDVAVKEPGKCGGGEGKSCGGFAGEVCPEGTKCSIQAENEMWCDGFDVAGPCWVVPAACESAPQVRSCLTGDCAPLCELLYSGDTWFVDMSCPQ
jgi:hypothetical protein